MTAGAAPAGWTGGRESRDPKPRHCGSYRRHRERGCECPSEKSTRPQRAHNSKQRRRKRRRKGKMDRQRERQTHTDGDRQHAERQRETRDALERSRGTRKRTRKFLRAWRKRQAWAMQEASRALTV